MTEREHEIAALLFAWLDQVLAFMDQGQKKGRTYAALTKEAGEWGQRIGSLLDTEDRALLPGVVESLNARGDARKLLEQVLIGASVGSA
mgnify:CR=1 FL=1